MTIQFKYFVTEIFKKLVDSISEFKGFDESEFLSFRRFKKVYTKELTDFSERWKELQTTLQEQLKTVENDEEKNKIQEATMVKIQQLLDCESELKPLDYNKIKKAISCEQDLEILENVLINIPTVE